jgi:lipopolysaccharide transport system permease protein
MKFGKATEEKESKLLPTDPSAKTPSDEREFWIRPTRGWRFIDLRELWKYRELVYFLTWRDIKVRYKQTAVGIAWAVLQPIAMMAVFTLIFGRLAKIPSEGVPYPLFAFAGLLPWQLFSRTISESSGSLVKDQRMITKIYFPRIIIPISTTLAATLDFLISASLLAVLMAFYGKAPGVVCLTLPLFVSLMLITSLGMGFWLSALNVEYRDIMYIVPFLNQFLLFLTPVVYPSRMVPEKFRILYGLNPMVGVVEGFRWALFGKGEGPPPMLIVSVMIAGIIFVSGVIWFRYRERKFVDILGS